MAWRERSGRGGRVVVGVLAAVLGLLPGIGVAAYRDIGAREAEALIEAGRGDDRFALLDLRTPREFEEERIDGAVLIDFLSPGFRGELSNLDRGKRYLVYCRSGNRSRQALSAFDELGFGDVVHLAKGILGWKEAGLPTVRGGP